MSIDFPKGQFELFPGSSAPASKSEKRKGFWLNLTLTLDNLIIMAVVMIMAMVVSFSIGVEKGKKYVRPKPEPEQSDSRAKINRVGQPPVVDRVSESASAVPQPETVIRVMDELANEPQPSVVEEVTEIAQLPAGAYTVQVASFKKENQAREEATALEKKGYEIYVLPKGGYSIVCVGKFNRRNEAQLLSAQLKKRYKDCLIRRL